MVADLILLNGKVITVNREDTIAEAVAIKDQRIISVGNTKEIKEMVGHGTEVIDLEGKTILPGFVDAHFHLCILATYLAYHMHLNVPEVTSVKDILEVIRKRVRQTPKGQWIIGRGNFWLDQKLKEKRFPTKSELDEAAPDHPILLVAAGHLSILNSLALNLVGITKDTPQPTFGRIEKDPLTGEPTGVLMELRMERRDVLPIPPIAHEQLKDALRKHITLLPQYGITSIHDIPSNTDGIKVYQELLKDGDLPIRIRLYIIVPRIVDLESIVRLGLLSGFGNEWLQFGGVKLFVDGEWESGCAAMNEPYSLETFPSYPQNIGCLALNQEELTNLVVEAHKAGLQVCAHATGDKAIDMFITSVEAAQKRMPRRDHRHRIEHAGILQLTPSQIEKMKKTGIIPSPQPQFLHSFGDFLERLYGEERTKSVFPFKTLLNEGFQLPGSSDSTGTEPEAVNPFWGIWCAVTRQTYFGKVICPNEKIGVMDAIRMFTINSAMAGFEENVKGSIEPGKLGDLIVLAEDPFTVKTDEIKDIKVELTIIGGKIVYRRQDFSISQ